MKLRIFSSFTFLLNFIPTFKSNTNITHVYNPISSEIEVTGETSSTQFFKIKKWRQKYAKPVTTSNPNSKFLSSEWDQMLTPNGRYIVPVFFDTDSQRKDIGATYESHDKYIKNYKSVFYQNFIIAADKFRENTCIDLIPLKINKKSRLNFDLRLLFQYFFRSLNIAPPINGIVSCRV